LASLENAAARQVLVQRLSQEADAAVLEEIAHALWRGLHTAVPLGQQAHPLLRHRNSEVRVAGLRLLEFTTLDTALLPVVAGMLSDTVVSVREGAARLLSRYSHAPDATMGLLRALRDPQSAVRNAACQYIHSGSAPLLLLSLQQIAEDPQDTRRPEAISALGHAGAAYTPTLLQIAADAQDPLRVAAIHALAKPADTAVVDGILPLLPTAPPPVRQEILAILATSDDPRTVEVFVPLLQATDAGERLLATQALASATDPRVAQALLAQFPAQCGEAELRAIAYHPEDNGDPEQATPSLPLRTALTLQRIGDPAIAALDQLLADTQPSRRAAAAALLCLQRDGRSVPLLAAALHDTDVQVRLFAAHALCLRGVLESLPALTAAAGDADARVRAEVALALGALEDRRATATLTTLLRDTDADVQLAAALSLRRLADPQATPALLAALDAAPDTGVGTAILFALGASADPRAATAALAALSRTDPLLRGSAIYTLGKLHASQAVAPLCALISQGALNQNTDQAVQQYNQRLQRLGAPSMSMLDASLSIIAIQALGEIGDAAALPTLQALLTTVEPQQFALVLAAYAHCGAPATAVQQHLADDTYRSSNYSSSTTVFYDPALHAAVSEAMLKRLRSRDVEVQTATLQFFLARFRNTFEDPAAPRSWVAQLAPRLIDATLPLLAAQDAKVRQSAATLLGYLRTPRATQPLLARLGTADSNEALTIGAALAMIADPHAIDPLLQLLSQGKPVLRAGVIYALTPLHSPQVADALARVLQNPDQQLRMLAARALAVQHDTRAVAPLLEQSDAPEVSLYNLLPLVSMADARVAEALLRLLADRKNQQFGFLLWMSPDARVTTALLGHLQSLDTLGASALMGIPDLLHMADQPTPEIQLCFGEFADTARAKLHDPQVLAALLTMLRQYQRYMPDRVAFARSEHGYYSPAQSALSLLGTSGDTTATPALIDCLERGNSDFRQAAAAALGQLKDRRAIAPLIRALGEFGGTARPTVATALAALTGQSFGTDAEQWQTWWEAQPGR
jgi:HEAT repeat protein